MVVFVVMLVAMSYAPLVVYRDNSSVLSRVHLAVFHALIGMLLASYLMTVFVDPGTPPEWWLARETERGNPMGLRMCSRSDQLKPPRSHYCSVTRRLVLNMDHFCPWVNNTVGFYNRKFFLLFLVYSCVTCLYSAVMLYLDGSLSLMTPKNGETLGMATIRLMAMMVDVSLGVALIFFAFFHIGMAAKNETTIESCGLADPKYDLGSVANLESVFGANRWLWLLPVYGQGPVGDGIHWPTRELGIDESSHMFTDVQSDDSV